MRYVCAAAAAVIGFSILVPSRLVGQGSGAGLSITNYQLVSEERLSNTESNFTYRAVLVNTGSARNAITATASSTSSSLQIVEANLHFAPVPANGQVLSSDTFTFFANRTQPINFAALQWTFVAPFANAGPNQTAGVGSTVTLNGSGSSNPSGIGSLAYNWTFLSRPAGSSAILSNATNVTASFVVDVPGSYIVRLTLSNSAGVDTAIVIVSTTNSPPVANAGPNQTVAIGATVTLNGSGSSDVNGDPITYSWTLPTRPNGSTAALAGPATVSPIFVADKPGLYVAQLIVNDGKVNSSPATVTIATQNTAPVANAGPNQAITTGALVQLNGAGSTDVDADTLTYQWSLITVPSSSTAALNAPTAVNPTFTADRPGTYVAQLIVSDGKVNSTPATVTITTNTVQAPTANAGPNQTVKHGVLVQLSGSGTDPQARPLTLVWSLITRPTGSTAGLSSLTIANPTFVADRPGTYVGQLIVNNGFQNSAPATVTITTTNTAPLANAGPGQSVALGSTVTLNGAASSDADGDALTYAWSFTSRPAGSTAALSAASSFSPTFLADVLGTYVVQLIVNDTFASSNPATVTITASNKTITLTPDPLTLSSNSPGTLTVTLGAPAGPSGQQITLAAIDSSVASVQSNALVPPNATSVNVTVTPGALGSTTIAASATGFRSGTATVTVGTPTISVTLASSTLGVTHTTTGTITLSTPAPGSTAVNIMLGASGIVTVQPASVSIPAGGTTGTFTITGVAVGNTSITASAAGYSTGPAAQVTVGQLGVITLPATVSVGPGQSAPLPVSLLTPAPVGGVTIALASSNTSRVTIAPGTVTIVQGATTPATLPQVTGVSFGSATITATASGFQSGNQTVTVSATLSFSPSTASIGAGGTRNLTLNLSAPAPAGGVTVGLSSSNVNAATVPPNVVFAPGATSANVVVTALGSGSATITANPGSSSIIGATANITVTVLGTITMPASVTVALGQSTPVQIALSVNAPTGGVIVSLVSNNTSRATVSPASVNIAAGSNAPATQPQITGVGIGTVTITASAPGFGSATQTVQATASLSFAPPSLTINGATTQNLTLTLSGPAPAGGLAVSLNSSNPAAATVPATVNIAQNTTTATVPVTGVAAGATQIRATAPSVTQALANVTVQAAGGIGLPANVRVAPGQAVAFPVTLPSPALSNVTVSLVSNNSSRVTILPASVIILAGQTQPSQQPQVRGVSFGSAGITATAPGYTPGNQTVQVGATLSFAQPNVTLPGAVTQNIALNLSAPAPAGGLAVTLASSNPGVAAVPSSVTIPQNLATVNVPISGAGAGSAVVTASSSAPNIVGSTVNVTVQSAGGIGLPSGVTVGLGQSVAFPVTLASPAPAGGVTVTLASSDAGRVTVLPVSVSVAAGQTQPATQPQVRGIALGTANISASAPGFGSAVRSVQVTGTIGFTPPTLSINGTTTQNLTLTLPGPAPAGGLTVTLTSNSTNVATVPATVSFAPNATTVAVPVTGVAPGTAAILASAPNVGQATANVTVTPGVDIVLPANVVVAPGASTPFNISLARPAPQSTFITLSISDPSKATLNLTNIFISAGQTVPVSQAKVNGITAGTVTITATSAGLATATASVLVGFRMNFVPADATVVRGTTHNLTLTLSSAAPVGGVPVTLSSSNPAVATVPTSLTFTEGTMILTVRVTGVAQGSAVIRANSVGLPEATANVTVVNPGAILVPATTSVEPGKSVAFPVTLSTPAPAGGVTVTLSSSNTARLTVSPATVTIPAGQTQPAIQPQVTGVSAGAAIITASASGYSSATGTVQVTATVTISTASLLPGTVGTAYSQAITAVGGTQPYTFALASGVLPAGLTLNPTSGLITGTPTATATNTPLTFRVTDSSSPALSATRAFTLTISQATGTSIVATSGSGQSAAINTPFANRLVATVRNAGGNPVSGVTVTFTAPATGASGAFGGANTAVTNAAGVATSLVFTANNSAGSYTVTASAPGVSTPASFALTNTGSSPASIVVTSGTPQSAAINTAFASPLVVTVRNAGGNPVSGVTVTFAAPATGPSGSFAGGLRTATTNASGVAASAVFTANGAAGAYTVSASVTGVSTTANFALTNTGGTVSIAATSGTPQSARINTAFTGRLIVIVRDAGGNPLSGVTVTFTAPAAGARGTFASGINTAVTNASGVATSGVFTANNVLGSYIVSAGVPGASTPANFALTNIAGAAASITVTSGTPQSAVINAAFANRLVATVKDAGGNPVSGATVTFTAPAAGARGTFAGGVNTAVTNAAGVATSAVFTANATAGSYTVTAAVPGAATPASFPLTNTAGPAASITATGGTPQTVMANSAFPLRLIATVRDAGANLVSGATVTFIPPATGASGSFAGGVTTAVTNASGVATSAVFTANSTVGSYTVRASVPGVGTQASFALTNITAGPALSLTGATVGKDLQAQISLTLPGPAPAGGQRVTIESTNPGQLLVAGRPGDPGVSQLLVTVGEGLTTITGIYMQALGSSGTVQVRASATGFSPGVANVTLAPSGFVLAGPNGVGTSFPLSQGSSTQLTVSAARLNAALGFVETQQVRGGAFFSINISNSAPSQGTVSPTTVTIPEGDADATTTFTANPSAAGSAVLTAVVPAGFSQPAQAANSVTANFIASGLTAPNVTVGQNLQAPTAITLNSPASGSGLAVTVTSSDSGRLLFSTTPQGAGVGAITLNVEAGRRNTAQFYVYGLQSSGTATYTAMAPGFGTAVGTVTLTPSGFVIMGPLGLGVDFSTTVGAANIDLTIFAARLNASRNYVEQQPVRGGVSASVNITSSATAVGTITTSPLTFTGGTSLAVTQFNPASLGAAVLTASTPTGFSTPAQHGDVTATVATPNLAVTNGVTIGRNLQVFGTLLLGEPAGAGGVAVTLTSSSGQLRLSNTATAAGAGSITINIPAGQTSATYFIQAFSDSGSANYTATAPGYASKTGTITMGKSGVVMAGPFGFGFQLLASLAGGNQPVTVFTALLNANDAMQATQQLAGGLSLQVEPRSSGPGIGTITSPVTITGGSDNAVAQFTPVAAGQTTLSLLPVAGYTMPSNFTTLIARVN